MLSRRLAIGIVLGLALVPMLFVGACLTISIGAGFLNYRDNARDASAARNDPRLKQPLVSTSGRILFLAQTATTYDAYVVNVDGTGARRLTHSPPETRRFPVRPAVSPDGRWFATNHDGLSLVRIDQPAEVSRPQRPSGGLAWSPDSQRLAALDLDADKRLHLNVFDAVGDGDVRDLAASWPSTADGYEQLVADFSWSPDGRFFAFLLRTGVAKGPRGIYRWRSDLYIAPADGSGLKNLSSHQKSPIAAGGLAWSPDSQRLLFESTRGIGTIDHDLAATEFDVEVHPSRTKQRPAWSPDGATIAWFNQASIVVSTPEGTERHEITRGRDAGVQPAWAQDGTRLAFVCAEFRGLCVMNRDGSGLTSVIDLDSGAPVFAKGAQRISSPVWIPDPPR